MRKRSTDPPTLDLALDRSGRVPPRRLRRKTPPYGLYAFAGASALVLLVASAVVTGLARGQARLAGGGAEERVVVSEYGVTATKPIVDLAAEKEPTPFFASYRSLRLHMPVAPKDLTVMAFHQASRDNALHMKSLVKLVKPTSKKRRTKPADKDGPIYGGSAIALYRSGRSGKPDTAVDVGGKAGAPVYAPVSGVVKGIRRYKLYGKYEDFEIHILPDGWPEADCVVIHIDDVTVRAGDAVKGGVTPIAHVRRLSSRLDMQLADYSGDGGDHTHVQLNRLKVPGKLDPLRSDQRPWHLGWVE